MTVDERIREAERLMAMLHGAEEPILITETGEVETIEPPHVSPIVESTLTLGEYDMPSCADCDRYIDENEGKGGFCGDCWQDRLDTLDPPDKALMEKLQRGQWSVAELRWLQRQEGLALEIGIEVYAQLQEATGSNL
jgi:hypothetical protein